MKKNPPRPLPTHDPAAERAAEVIDTEARKLLRDLAAHIGDPARVVGVLDAYLDRLDVEALALVGLRAVAVTFTECLRLVPGDEFPPGGATLDPPDLKGKP